MLHAHKCQWSHCPSRASAIQAKILKWKRKYWTISRSHWINTIYLDMKHLNLLNLQSFLDKTTAKFYHTDLLRLSSGFTWNLAIGDSRRTLSLMSFENSDQPVLFHANWGDAPFNLRLVQTCQMWPATQNAFAFYN